MHSTGMGDFGGRSAGTAKSQRTDVRYCAPSSSFPSCLTSIYKYERDYVSANTAIFAMKPSCDTLERLAVLIFDTLL